MARATVLAGRTLSDVVTNFLGMVVLVVSGLIIGFRVYATVPDIVLGMLLLVLFGYAFSWVFAFVGLIVSSPESANSVGFIAVFPLTVISSAFVPPQTFPSVLRHFSDVNPFTIMVNAIGHLWEGRIVSVSGANVWQSPIWIAVILAVFAPLGVARYCRAAGN